MALSSFALKVNVCSVHKPALPPSHKLDDSKISKWVDLKHVWQSLPKMPLQDHLTEAMKITSRRMLDAFVDTAFEYVDQPFLPSQKNFAPVEEIGEAIEVFCCEGQIPSDFPLGVFIRNGPNPLFGSLLSTRSMFGGSSETWAEGDGMLHALYFRKDDISGNWMLSYKNRYVESETFQIEKRRGKPTFPPVLEGDSRAIIAASYFNNLRYGVPSKKISNTNVFEHAGKVYAVSENYLPQEVSISTLETRSEWNFEGDWGRPFTSHTKRAPVSGELVLMGAAPKKPYLVVGIISADGKKLNHKVDLKLERSVFSHEIGVTMRYNVIIDHPLVYDTNRLINGGPLLKYEKGGHTRIGVMPRYGNESSVKWFDVESSCIFHLFNCFEDGDEVVVRGCQAPEAVFPGPEWGKENKFEWFSRGFDFRTPVSPDADQQRGYLFTRAYEWKLNMRTGQVEETYLTGTDFATDIPFINPDFTGLHNKYGYAEVIDSEASSKCGKAKYGSLAKLYFDEPAESTLFDSEERVGREKLVKVEYHNFEKNNFCNGTVFVPKNGGGSKEDSGWVVSWVHNEETDVTQVHVIDAENFGDKPIAKINLPQRVPYGFHGTFVPMAN